MLGLVGSYLGIYFYLRVIQYMFMSAEDAVGARVPRAALALGASLLCLAPGHRSRRVPRLGDGPNLNANSRAGP